MAQNTLIGTETSSVLICNNLLEDNSKWRVQPIHDLFRSSLFMKFFLYNKMSKNLLVKC